MSNNWSKEKYKQNKKNVGGASLKLCVLPLFYVTKMFVVFWDIQLNIDKNTRFDSNLSTKSELPNDTFLCMKVFHLKFSQMDTVFKIIFFLQGAKL